MTAYQATPDEKPRLEIEFCTKCRFQGRAFWMARELFDVVPEIVGEIALVPSSGGVFTVRYGGAIVWELATNGRFPEPKDIRELMLTSAGLPPREKHH
jgi:selenoprotein W-related protein